MSTFFIRNRIGFDRFRYNTYNVPLPWTTHTIMTSEVKLGLLSSLRESNGTNRLTYGTVGEPDFGWTGEVVVIGGGCGNSVLVVLPYETLFLLYCLIPSEVYFVLRVSLSSRE